MHHINSLFSSLKRFFLVGNWIPGLCTPILAWKDCQENNNSLYEDWRYTPWKSSHPPPKTTPKQTNRWQFWLCCNCVQANCSLGRLHTCQDVLVNDVVQVVVIDFIDEADTLLHMVISKALTIVSTCMYMWKKACCHTYLQYDWSIWTFFTPHFVIN